jgi:ectoine hydroxylase-related dioxygenase (phytanoyl-CoA dioxygenase family)
METDQNIGITEAQVREFRDTGVLAIEQFFNARETAALQADIRRLRDGGFLRNVHTLGDGKTHADTAQNLQLCPAGYCSALVRALPFCPRVIETVRALLGAEIAQHLDQLFLKPAGIGKGTGWHQDNAYFQIRDPLKGTAMWIAIDDATAENGTMRVVPGRFRAEIEHTRDPQSDHHISCQIEDAEAVTVELPAGGVVFFCYGTPHSTRDNTSARDRAGLA